jgi:hypothetical protein
MIGDQTCTRAGCGNTFAPRGAGASRKKYCSGKCRNTVANARYQQTEKGQARSRRYEASAKGRKTRESWYYEKDGWYKKFRYKLNRRIEELLERRRADQEAQQRLADWHR